MCVCVFCVCVCLLASAELPKVYRACSKVCLANAYEISDFLQGFLDVSYSGVIYPSMLISMFPHLGQVWGKWKLNVLHIIRYGLFLTKNAIRCAMQNAMAMLVVILESIKND